MVIVGSTMSGKTWLTRQLIKTFARNFHTITILTGTPHTNDWTEIGIRPEAVSIPRLEELVNLAGEQYKTGQPGKFLLIVDDMIGTLKSTRGGVFGKLGTSGRHYGITSIWLTQDFNFVDKRIRGNVQDWIIMGCQARSVIKGVEEITPLSKKEFDTKYAELGEYDFLHISMYGGNKAVFSHKVPNYGYVERPIQSRRELAAIRFSEETAMRVRNEERKRAQVSTERDERSPLQTSCSQSSSSADPNATVTYYRAPADSSTVSSTTTPVQYQPTQLHPVQYPATTGSATTDGVPTHPGANSGERASQDATSGSVRGIRRSRSDAASSSSTVVPISSTIPAPAAYPGTTVPRGGSGGGIRSSIL